MEWYEQIVLKTLGGSHAYGLNTPESDMDERGVALPKVAWLLGFSPSGQGAQTHESMVNTDLVVHTLGKFCSLALSANPNILDMLFCREEEIIEMTVVGQALRGLREQFLSQRAYKSYAGYAAQQLKRMRNHNTDHGAHRELIDKFGYDTKNAMHLIRLLKMGKTLLGEGRVEVYRSDREFLLEVRAGKYSVAQVQKMAEELDAECKELSEHSVLPKEPNTYGIEQWLMSVHHAWIDGETWVLDQVEIGGRHEH